jgi:hypothetical protein
VDDELDVIDPEIFSHFASPFRPSLWVVRFSADKSETDYLFAFYSNNVRNVHVNNREPVLYGPVDVALGYISLRVQGQRLYSARLLSVLTSHVLCSCLRPVTGSG